MVDDNSEQYWAGNWSLLTGSIWGDYYTHQMEKSFGHGIANAKIISKKGHSACYLKKSDRQELGEYLAENVIANGRLPKFCRVIRERADQLRELVRKLKATEIIPADMQAFLGSFQKYTGFHISPRHIADFAPPELSANDMDELEKTRLYTEPVFKETEELMLEFAKQTGEKTGLPQELVLCMTSDELETYLQNGEIPGKSELTERFELSTISYTPTSANLFTGKAALEIEQGLFGNLPEGIVNGQTAFPGRAVGIARIVFDPARPGVFNEGDILITSMTRPEYLVIMKKAGAIVTDSGGTLCHVAIVARELKKPCLIGTRFATKVFKDGDLIEVQADKGIAKKSGQKNEKPPKQKLLNPPSHYKQRSAAIGEVPHPVPYRTWKLRPLTTVRVLS